MKTSDDETFAEILRSSRFKVTKARLALLQILKESGKPLSIAVISKRLAAVADQATVYRSLEALEKAGIVKKVDFHDSHAYYELLLGCAHHHHVVCQNCGIIEDVEVCDVRGLEATALKQAKKFESIESHSLEFFGTCSRCG